MIPAFEQATIVDALDRAATVIGYSYLDVRYLRYSMDENLNYTSVFLSYYNV
jgi:hypothetical protein